MIDLNGKNILCISAHMDDIEFGCGGTIAKYSKNAEIYVLALTANRKSFRGEIQEDRLIDEQKNALHYLGLNDDNLEINFEIAGQLFPEYRQLILEELYRIKKEFKPDIVFVPTYNDVHQDHRTVSISALKAFKRETVLGYEIINSAYGFNPNLFIRLSEQDITKKVEAIASYTSQYNGVTTTSDYFSKEAIFGLAAVRGARCGGRYAEGFEVYNMII